MQNFFTRFPGFQYNPKKQEELEFGRLCETQGWSRTSPRYKKVYKEFVQALTEDSGDFVHRFFLQYPDFDYQTRASPRAELERLRVFRKWSLTGHPYQRASNLFEEAFDKEFDSHVDYFFKCYEDFEYNPRNEPKAEYNRLKELKWSRTGRISEEERKKRLLEEAAAREEFYSGFSTVFAHFFGSSGSDTKWRFLCNTLGVNPVPPFPSAKQEAGKEVFENMHVNIFNLIDHMQEKTPIIFFPDLEALSEYSLKNKLVFPESYADGTTLKFLLRRISGCQQLKHSEKKSKDPATTPGGEGSNGGGDGGPKKKKKKKKKRKSPGTTTIVTSAGGGSGSDNPSSGDFERADVEHGGVGVGSVSIPNDWNDDGASRNPSLVV